MTVAEASLRKVVGRLQLKNYLVQVLRLLKHLLLYYSRVSNCLTESMALKWFKFKYKGYNQRTASTHSHKIIVALAEFGNFVIIDSLSAAAAASDSTSQYSDANVASESRAAAPDVAVDSERLGSIGCHGSAVEFAAVAAAAESAGDLFFADSDDDSFCETKRERERQKV